jgi:hypothetical protein
MEWVRFYKQSPLKYNMNALLAVLENDGEAMLLSVLKSLGLTQSLALVKDASEKFKSDNKSSPSESPTKEGGTPPLPLPLENLD